MCNFVQTCNTGRLCVYHTHQVRVWNRMCMFVSRGIQNWKNDKYIKFACSNNSCTCFNKCTCHIVTKIACSNYMAANQSVPCNIVTTCIYCHLFFSHTWGTHAHTHKIRFLAWAIRFFSSAFCFFFIFQTTRFALRCCWTRRYSRLVVVAP